MAVKYCGDCQFFEPEEEGAKRGYCPRIRADVWNDDFVPEDDDSCFHYEEKDEDDE